MSDAHDHDDAAADAHDDHAFDGEPATELAPDEAPTPGWVPAVGAALFAVAGIFFLIRHAGPGTPGPAAQPAAPQPAATQVVATALPARVPIKVGAPGAAPAAAPGAPGAATGADSIRKMSPEQLKDLQRRIQDAAQKAKPQGAAGAK